MKWTKFGNTYTSGDYSVVETGAVFRLEFCDQVIREYSRADSARRGALRHFQEQRVKQAA